MFSETGILPMVLLYTRYNVDSNVKLPGHPVRTGTPELPGKVILFHIVPLDPAHKAGFAWHVPVEDSLRPILRGHRQCSMQCPLYKHSHHLPAITRIHSQVSYGLRPIHHFSGHTLK